MLNFDYIAKEDIKNHWMKSVQIRGFFWSVFSCIRTEYRKIWTRKSPSLYTSRSEHNPKWSKFLIIHARY